MPADDTTTTAEEQYRDDELVYIDPEIRQVIGRVELDENGKPKSLPYAKKKDEGKHAWRKNHPFGTYRSMKRAFRLMGKQKEEDLELTLEEVLPKVLNDQL